VGVEEATAMKLDECRKCRKTLQDNPASVFGFGPSLGSLSSDIIYNCKACGASYCIDCMSQMKKAGGICPSCGKSSGW
jgi:hypothetical protein